MLRSKSLLITSLWPRSCTLFSHYWNLFFFFPLLFERYSFVLVPLMSWPNVKTNRTVISEHYSQTERNCTDLMHSLGVSLFLRGKLQVHYNTGFIFTASGRDFEYESILLITDLRTKRSSGKQYKHKPLHQKRLLISLRCKGKPEPGVNPVMRKHIFNVSLDCQQFQILSSTDLS